jgi:tRNA nucleotidyltransferase (CCA-adding enzyme)
MDVEFRGPVAAHQTTLIDLCRTVSGAGGRCLVVGGAVRDALSKRPADEYDLEVFGLEAGALLALLEEKFRIDRVGEAFGVVKLRDHPFDIALPRRESKRGLGHRGFEVYSDPAMTFEEAAARRDFTINAIAFDPLSGEILDPYRGAADLEERILRHVSPRFVDDPLRVLRGAQFIARFELRPAPETVSLCRRIGLEGLASERIFEELRKLILRGLRPSLGLEFLRQVEWLRFFPEIDALVGCPQDPLWHPEGDVFVHTGLVLDAFAGERLGDAREDLVVGLACLCHDLGKPATTVVTQGRVRSPGHEALGEPPTRSLIGRLTPQRRLVDEVVPLVRDHLKPQQLFDSQASDAAVRRLARRVGRIDRLIRVVRADQRGRSPKEPEDAATDWLQVRAEQLAVEDSAPAPLVLGRHLIARGYSPGPAFRPVLEAIYEAQLDGALDGKGVERWLDMHLTRIWSGVLGKS